MEDVKTSKLDHLRAVEFATDGVERVDGIIGFMWYLRRLIQNTPVVMEGRDENEILAIYKHHGFEIGDAIEGIIKDLQQLHWDLGGEYSEIEIGEQEEEK